MYFYNIINLLSVLSFDIFVDPVFTIHIFFGRKEQKTEQIFPNSSSTESPGTVGSSGSPGSAGTTGAATVQV